MMVFCYGRIRYSEVCQYYFISRKQVVRCHATAFGQRQPKNLEPNTLALQLQENMYTCASQLCLLIFMMSQLRIFGMALWSYERRVSNRPKFNETVPTFE